MSFFTRLDDALGVQVRVTGDEALGRQFQATDSRIRAELRALLPTLGEEVAARARAAAPVATGRGASRGIRAYFTETDRVMLERVRHVRVALGRGRRSDADKWYMLYHEMGIDRQVVKVAPHTRRVRSRDASYLAKVGVVRGKYARRMARGEAQVRSYKRTMQLAARPFLEPAFDGDRAQDRVGQAIDETLAQLDADFSQHGKGD